MRGALLSEPITQNPPTLVNSISKLTFAVWLAQHTVSLCTTQSDQAPSQSLATARLVARHGCALT